MTELNQENMLSRWSRRKQQSILESENEDHQINAQQHGIAGLQNDKSLLEIDDTEPVVILTDADMPPINSLDEDSDFSGFMSTGVSDELRNLALRKLFNAPSYNLRDGLDEYDEDYTSFEKLGDIVTCDMKHQIEMEAKKKLEKEANKLTDPELDKNSELPETQQDDQDEDDLTLNTLPISDPPGSETPPDHRLDDSDIITTNSALNNE